MMATGRSSVLTMLESAFAGPENDKKFEYTSLITAIMAFSVALPAGGRQDSEFEAYGFVWLRKVSLFFKAFQNGYPNWKREAPCPTCPLQLRRG